MTRNISIKNSKEHKGGEKLRDELNEQENQLLGAILDIAFETGVEEGQQVIDAMFGGAEFGLSETEKEERTWSTLERIHGGSPTEVCRAIIEGKWVKDGVMYVPYHELKYFAVGYAGHKLEIDLANSEWITTVTYVKRLWHYYNNMNRATDHWRSNMRYKRPRR